MNSFLKRQFPSGLVKLHVIFHISDTNLVCLLLSLDLMVVLEITSCFLRQHVASIISLSAVKV